MTIKKVLVLIMATTLVAFFLTFYFSYSEDEILAVDKPKVKDAFSFVRSMEGTVSDGVITQSSEGELVVNVELRLLFDYYLAATGEKNLKDIVMEIEGVLDKKLSPRASAQAKNILARYITYKQALAEVEKKQAGSTKNAISAMRDRFLAMQDLRQQFFNKKENQAMFGFDDLYDMDALARLEIDQNSTLTRVEKQQQTAALDAAMSPSLREAKEAPYQVVRLDQRARELRAHGASEDDVYRMRATATTHESAARLAEVDREEAQWKNRISNYLAETNRVKNALAGRNVDEQQAALQQIRDHSFTREEQKRLGAYE
jgi:lipase chaperone LimK